MFGVRIVLRPFFSTLCVQETAMRRLVVLLVTSLGLLAGLMAAADDAAACHWRRGRTVCYCPPPAYYCPPPGYYFSPPPSYYCPPPGYYLSPPTAYAPLAPRAAQPRAIAIKGKTYHVLPTGEKGEHDQEELFAQPSVIAKTSGINKSD